MKGIPSIPTAVLAVLAGAGLLIQSASAQVRFSSANPYFQNFNALASSGNNNAWRDNVTLPGWYASTNGSTSGSVTNYRGGIGDSTAGALYSFGASSASDRALGSIASGGPGNLAYGVRFTNDTGLAVGNITITYAGEQWRNSGNLAVQTQAFSFRISSTPITSADAANANTWTSFAPLDFVSLTVGSPAGSLDGNVSANRRVFSNVPLPGVVVYAGEEIFFRWFDLNDAGNDHGLAIDDLSIAFTTFTPATNEPAIDPGGQPQSRTNNAGTTAAFSVTATGGTLAYQWRKEGYDLSDGARIWGAATPTLWVSNVVALDAGEYSVVVTNGAGSVTSEVAVLTVIDPVIRTQPLARTNVAGDTAEFYVSAAGTGTLGYQWRFNNEDMPGAIARTLSIRNLKSSDQGGYSAVVVNGNGNSITSAVATLTVLPTPAANLACWDFNATNTLSANAPLPSSGNGTAMLVGGTKGEFASGTGSDSSGAPGPLNSGWNTKTYPAQGTGNKTAGVQFNVSTLGYRDILLTWEQRHSDTASKYTRVQYSMDGVNFLDGPVLAMNATDNSFVFCSAELSAIPVVNDNPGFAFRIVSEWEATALGNQNSNYVATVTSYNTSGTVRFDVVNVYGNPLSSAPAQIPLAIQQFGAEAVLTWSNPAFPLEWSTQVEGPYTPLTGAASPYTNPVSGEARFFRLHWQQP